MEIRRVVAWEVRVYRRPAFKFGPPGPNYAEACFYLYGLRD